MAATRIGWIGVGVMGKSMCAHLINAGYTATVFNRTAEKCAPLAELVRHYSIIISPDSLNTLRI